MVQRLCIIIPYDKRPSAHSLIQLMQSQTFLLSESEHMKHLLSNKTCYMVPNCRCICRNCDYMSISTKVIKHKA